MEILPVSEAIREMILKGGSTDDIRNLAVKEGMRTLVVDGWLKVLTGITTVEEVMRVCNM